MSEQSYTIKHVVVILIESNYITKATYRHSTRSLSSSRKLMAVYASFCEEHLSVFYGRNYAIQDVLSQGWALVHFYLNMIHVEGPKHGSAYFQSPYVTLQLKSRK